MEIDIFVKVSLAELKSRTGIHQSQWSRYFNGQPISERTLRKAGIALKMSTLDVLAAIELRREVLANASTNEILVS